MIMECDICKEYVDIRILHEIIIVPAMNKEAYCDSLWVCTDCLQPLAEGVTEAIASTMKV